MAAEGKSGISGLGVAMSASGVFLMYAGIRNVPLLSGVRELFTGQLPTGTPPTKTVVQWDGTGNPPGATWVIPGGPLNDQIVEAAAQYVDKVMYKFGGAQGPDIGMDCSGLVNWVLGHDLGMRLPLANAPGFDGSSHGPITTDYLAWGGAKTIPRGGMEPGDLLCGTGHIAIATGPAECIDAPTFGQHVHRTSISWTLTPTVRRVQPQDPITKGPVKAK